VSQLQQALSETQNAKQLAEKAYQDTQKLRDNAQQASGRAKVYAVGAEEAEANANRAAKETENSMYDAKAVLSRAFSATKW
jgi:hypothetical protein